MMFVTLAHSNIRIFSYFCIKFITLRFTPKIRLTFFVFKKNFYTAPVLVWNIKICILYLTVLLCFIFYKLKLRVFHIPTFYMATSWKEQEQWKSVTSAVTDDGIYVFVCKSTVNHKQKRKINFQTSHRTWL